MKIEKPYRRKQTAVMEVAASPDDVFALMCPVREYDWAPGWTTNMILSNSGLVEQDCIFTTPAGGNDDNSEAVWVTPFHDPKKCALTMIKVAPGACVTRLDIDVAEGAAGAILTVSYEHTALSDAGRSVVDDHGAANFEAMIGRWKAAVENHLGTEKTAA